MYDSMLCNDCGHYPDTPNHELGCAPKHEDVLQVSMIEEEYSRGFNYALLADAVSVEQQ